jgi:divalent metal cation (Fe/Co/Zn/Cd) transporter
LATEAVQALAEGSAPSESVSAMISAGAAAAIATPLGMAKRRVGAELCSPALEGDGVLSAIGGVLGLLALLGLVADRAFASWWADRVAALAAAALAAGEAVRVFGRRPRYTGAR